MLHIRHERYAAYAADMPLADKSGAIELIIDIFAAMLITPPELLLLRHTLRHYYAFRWFRHALIFSLQR